MTSASVKKKRPKRLRHRPLPLTEALILRWADAHFERTGAWPRQTTGEVADAPGTTWRGADLALRRGRRGLPGGSSLARLLARRRRVRSQLLVRRLQGSQEGHFGFEEEVSAMSWPTLQEVADVLQALGSCASWCGVGARVQSHGQQRQVSTILNQADRRYNSLATAFPNLPPDVLRSDPVYQDLLNQAERISPGTKDLLL